MLVLHKTHTVISHVLAKTKTGSAFAKAKQHHLTNSLAARSNSPSEAHMTLRRHDQTCGWKPQGVKLSFCPHQRNTEEKDSIISTSRLFAVSSWTSDEKPEERVVAMLPTRLKNNDVKWRSSLEQNFTWQSMETENIMINLYLFQKIMVT